MKAHSSLLLSFRDVVLREVVDQESAIVIWNKIEFDFLKKSFANRLILKYLYTLKMNVIKEFKKHVDDFNEIILDLWIVDVKFEKED